MRAINIENLIFIKLSAMVLVMWSSVIVGYLNTRLADILKKPNILNYGIGYSIKRRLKAKLFLCFHEMLNC